MTPALPLIQELALEMLMAEQGPERASPRAWIEAVDRVIGDLRRRLVSIIGREGFHALLNRALVLAKRESPWLQQTAVAADSGFAGLSDTLLEGTVAEVEAGCVALVSQLLELLNNFIGADLSQRLVGAAWRETAPDRFVRGKEETKE